LGLGIKVVIASEIMGIPRNSIGLLFKIAYNNYDYMSMVIWIFIIILICFLLEFLIKLASTFFLPWEEDNDRVK
jgi:ABC-type nitrate/sulfonate/bicarbonate transport system permease component